MKATAILKEEHQLILKVLAWAEHEIQSIETSGRVDIEKVKKLIDFAQNFADRCHHAKEEDLLFIKMKEKGMPTDQGPIAMMVQEHELNRQNMKAVTAALPQAAAGETAVIATVQQNLSAYASRLKLHIAKEDNILYPLADRLLTAKDQKDLNQAFARVEAEEMGAGVHEKYQKLAGDLAKELP